MKKITLNEELTRIQEMMGVKHTNPSGKDAIKELSPSDIVNSMREEEMGENDEVKDKFKDQYGKEKGEKVYYATANKQDRDPETFEKNEESAIGGWDLAMEEGNLGHNELASIEPEGRFWVVSWVSMDGKEEKVFTSEDDAREFMDSLDTKHSSEVPGFEGTMDALDNLTIREEEKSFMKTRGGKDGPVYENEEMGEARKLQQETYFETQAGALQSAEEYATHKGYTVNWESINPEHVAYGQTVSYSVELMKDGMPARKMLQISLYRMESGKYELTNYIN